MNSLNNLFVRLMINLGWIKISKPPKWVIHKANGYYDYFGKKYGHRPYDRIKHFKGNKFIYKVYYRTVAQGQIEEIFYAKKRKSLFF